MEVVVYSRLRVLAFEHTFASGSQGISKLTLKRHSVAMAAADSLRVPGTVKEGTTLFIST